MNARRSKVLRSVLLIGILCLAATPVWALKPPPSGEVHLNGIDANGNQDFTTGVDVPYTILLNTASGRIVLTAHGVVGNASNHPQLYINQFGDIGPEININFSIYGVGANGGAALLATGRMNVKT